MLTFFRHERSQPLRGQTLVLFALMSLLLLAGLGLIFDAGLDYSNRRTMQNAADTAALRGARIIAQKANTCNPGTGVGCVKHEVEQTALANGVPELANVICYFLDDDLNETACSDGAIPSGVTGVKVRVSETHAPIVMRALGITTTGTAASAAAQVQMVDAIFGRDFPFMVCGIETATVGGGTYSILSDATITDPGAGPSPSPMDFKMGVAPWQIESGAYSYDWNVREANGDFHDYNGPEFIIYGEGIEPCGLSNWQGLVRRSISDNDRVTLYTAPTLVEDDNFRLSKVEGSAGTVDDVSPNRSINGPQGCKADVVPNGCVMVLPIGDSDEWCPTLGNPPCFFEYEEDYANGTTLKLRRWGAFFITCDSTVIGSLNSCTGKLIKNYPIHTDGEPGWDPDDYVGPLNITVVQTP